MPFKRWESWTLVALVMLGGALRYSSAWNAPQEVIEYQEFIPGAMTLSWDHHPIRLAQHGALPHYFIRLSAWLFGETPFGFRALSVCAGTATILMLYLIGARWWGPRAGLVAAGLLAVERYHIAVSGRAIDLPFDLFFTTVAIYCLSRFLQATEGAARPPTAGRWLYGAVAATSAGFLCKEFAALMIPAGFLMLVFTGRAAWLRRREPWVAALLFAALISADVYSNLTTTQADRMVLLARQKQVMQELGIDLRESDYSNGLYMSYADHLSRFDSLSFSSEPFYFYFGDVLDAIGVPHTNEFDEFPYLNALMGIVLWSSVVAAALLRPRDSLTVLLIVMFVTMFLPFAVLQLGPPRSKLPTDASALWYWVDRTMLPAMLLAGHMITRLLSRGARFA